METVSVVLPVEVAADVRVRAAAEDRTVSNYLRRLIMAAIEDQRRD